MTPKTLVMMIQSTQSHRNMESRHALLTLHHMVVDTKCVEITGNLKKC